MKRAYFVLIGCLVSGCGESIVTSPSSTVPSWTDDGHVVDRPSSGRDPGVIPVCPLPHPILNCHYNEEGKYVCEGGEPNICTPPMRVGSGD